MKRGHPATARATLVLLALDVVTAGSGAPDPNGNVAGDEAGCYADTVPRRSDVIANPSLCVDRGMPGQRLDQTPIDRALEGAAPLRCGPDIGCHEAR